MVTYRGSSPLSLSRTLAHLFRRGVAPPPAPVDLLVAPDLGFALPILFLDFQEPGTSLNILLFCGMKNQERSAIDDHVSTPDL